jgi:light-regulated signal transduction histidine kinase (bacteriophytochrome)
MDKSRQRSIELEFLNHELSAFNYTVAHDLRSPLVWIGGYCRSILKHHSERLDEKPLEQLREICDGLLRMEQLISDLLDFSKLGQGELNRESVDLSELAKCVGEELMLAEPGRRVTFSIAEGVTSFSDKRLLKVVLENMLRNAWKYTSEQEEAVIEFGITNFKGKRAYFVRDNGDGFDMELAGKLFVPFQRLHDSDRFKGHGIGLATVKRIISRHNGEIWAESRKGKGATFYFKLGR